MQVWPYLSHEQRPILGEAGPLPADVLQRVGVVELDGAVERRDGGDRVGRALVLRRDKTDVVDVSTGFVGGLPSVAVLAEGDAPDPRRRHLFPVAVEVAVLVRQPASSRALTSQRGSSGIQSNTGAAGLLTARRRGRRRATAT